MSTQDTVVALQALSLYSQQVTRIPLSMEVDISEGGAKVVPQKFPSELHPKVRNQGEGPY